MHSFEKSNCASNERENALCFRRDIRWQCSADADRSEGKPRVASGDEVGGNVDVL